MEASTSSANQIQPSNISIQDRLKLSISEYTSLTTDAAATEPNDLKREFNWNDKNKKRTVLLDQLYVFYNLLTYIFINIYFLFLFMFTFFKGNMD